MKKVLKEEDHFQIFPFIQLKTILLLKEDLEAFYDFLCYILKYCMYELIAISKTMQLAKTSFIQSHIFCLEGSCRLVPHYA